MDKRKHMGKDKKGVIFPVAPNLSEVSDSYLQFIEEIKKEMEEKTKKLQACFRKGKMEKTTLDILCVVL